MHIIEFPCDLTREEANLLIEAVLIVNKINAPVTVKIITPSWMSVTRINKLHPPV